MDTDTDGQVSPERQQIGGVGGQGERRKGGVCSMIGSKPPFSF